jgi:hypothetical protein
MVMGSSLHGAAFARGTGKPVSYIRDRGSILGRIYLRALLDSSTNVTLASRYRVWKATSTIKFFD